MDSFVVGVDIGGTGTKFGIVDSVGNVLFSSEMSTKNMSKCLLSLMNWMKNFLN